MVCHLIFGTILFIALVVGLEYLIRHALMPPGPDQWTWDQWDWLTLGVALFFGIGGAIIIGAKTKKEVLVVPTTWPNVPTYTPSLSSPTLTKSSEIYATPPVISSPMPSSPQITSPLTNPFQSSTPSSLGTSPRVATVEATAPALEAPIE